MTDKASAHARRAVSRLTEEQRDAVAEAYEVEGLISFVGGHEIGIALYKLGIVDSASRLTPHGLAVRHIILEQRG